MMLVFALEEGFSKHIFKIINILGLSQKMTSASVMCTVENIKLTSK